MQKLNTNAVNIANYTYILCGYNYPKRKLLLSLNDFQIFHIVFFLDFFITDYECIPINPFDIGIRREWDKLIVYFGAFDACNKCPNFNKSQ